AADSDDPLLATLKSLRLKLAKERRLPAYLIFSDRTLLDMAARRPRNEEEFAAVNGVGAAKLQEFAAPFLTAIASHDKRILAESSPRQSVSSPERSAGEGDREAVEGAGGRD